ncbi:voltage-dependent calcium channel subunit alpha-2/delta-3 isoform X2 [Phlebotomus argentipes]|uniref:voltage-dependent calcium channel subunit alpha-2/delta-3 isoform X2 n=1 Tax=Phlebotomus argentipes TaxID=94469 RepID=UPI0028936FE4|nr:voltage-dependent calcium channel subunit alpha-2/delta-3 isoform X2 [Phlebotomus argentipes]
MDTAIYRVALLALLAVTLLPQVAPDQDEDIPHNEVRNWALKFGVDLWEFGRQFTKMNDIKMRYKDSDVDVVRKDGILLLREMAAEVKNFMDFKMNAVMRIMDSAEQAALSSETDQEPQAQTQIHNAANGFYDSRHLNEYASNGRLVEGAKEMLLRPMRRFERLPVNLTLSSILVPPGIDVNDADVQASIAWSSHLDPLFANNMERDPALSWQYFGSSKGFLRRFPGTAWPPDGQKMDKDINDFRTENWFVQAASSPKDIFILVDGSKSMCSSSNHHLASATVGAILDTLGDDDYVNVVTFTDSAKALVHCFSDKMVRATPDNIKELKVAVDSMECEGSGNFTAGLEMAFQVLHHYNQSGQGSQCNQAIMLVTTGTSETHDDIIRHYNWPHMPVRLFTYLVGSGDSSSREALHTMACGNKGYYVQISSEEEARRLVLEYALVMARPMVLYQADHPVHWSPVFIGGRSAVLGRDSENRRRLVTAVTTPVFDRRNHSQRVANLLGVVGTDVPIEEIQKMIPQHKLGVNGYSFIVDNNGRILYHPDLRPLSDGSQYNRRLKPKYTSVDLTEVELPEIDTSGNGERESENTNLLLDMRQELVSQKEGESEFEVLQHLDIMKRISLRSLRYFYGPIDGTPFSLALALPEKYGMHELNAQQEIRHSHINVTEYFKGNSWKVHPDWVYCEYNNINDLERERENSGDSFSHEETFETPEDQVLHFLARAGRPGWKWMSVRPRSPQPHHGHGGIPVGHYSQHFNSGQGSRKAEPYFCDRTLIQSLVRDAIVTDGLDRGPTHPTRKEDKHPIATLMALLHRQGYQMFGVTVSFVATRSGLLRWVDHIPHPPDSPEPHFSESNTRAMDMTWYKRAVDQHAIEPDSFVFSVPFDSGYTGKSNATLVTAAHAIFIDHRGHKAPAAVVGLQFQHDSLARHFINITSACTASGCRKTCASDELDCYLLDNHGFVLLSEDSEHTGRFFGQIDGTIMDSLVQDRIYRRVPLMDYQGACSDSDSSFAAAGQKVKPPKPLSWLLDYGMSLAVSWLSLMPAPISAWSRARYGPEYTDQDEDDIDDINYSDDYDTNFDYPPISNDYVTAPEIIFERPTQPPPRPVTPPPGPRVIPDPNHARPCDLKTDLYILQPDRLNSSGQSNPLKGKLTNCHSSGCERPFSVQKIPHSNLILLVVDTLCPCGSKQLDIEPQEVTGGRGACGTRRQAKENLPRKRPQKCINYHPEETEIQQCGRATRQAINASLLSTIFTFTLLWTVTHV